MNLEAAREILLLHAKSKRNGAFDDEALHVAKILNPVCGDHVEMRAVVRHGVLVKLGFAAKACAICTASASLLSESVNGWTIEDAALRRASFERAVTQGSDEIWPEELKTFRCFEHLRLNPRRRACAILPWLALEKIFKAQTPVASRFKNVD